MTRHLIHITLGMLLASIFNTSFAGTHCTENITSAILHSNGNIYFNSERTCVSNWCQIDWGTEDKNKKAFAALLLAKATSKPIVFYWPNLNSCSESNVVYASPAYLMLN